METSYANLAHRGVGLDKWIAPPVWLWRPTESLWLLTLEIIASSSFKSLFLHSLPPFVVLQLLRMKEMEDREWNRQRGALRWDSEHVEMEGKLKLQIRIHFFTEIQTFISDIYSIYGKGDLYKLIISRKIAIFPFFSLSCSELSLYDLLNYPSQGISYFFWKLVLSAPYLPHLALYECTHCHWAEVLVWEVLQRRIVYLYTLLFKRDKKGIDSSVNICTGLMKFLLCILKSELKWTSWMLSWDMLGQYSL